MNSWIHAAALVTALLVGACQRPAAPSGAEAFDRAQATAVQQLVRGRLRDPDSAKWGSIWANDGGICGYVNAKNSFGAYAGPARFFGSPPLLYMDGVGDDGDQEVLNGFWADHCQAAQFVIAASNPPPPRLVSSPTGEEALAHGQAFLDKYAAK